MILDEVLSAVNGMAELEIAARTAAAANAIPPKSGRPPLLPADYIQALARVYHTKTGMKPGRGAGPFSLFVYEFIAAVNQPDFEFAYDSVIDAIKNAHRQYVAAGKRSMFDE